MIFKSFKNYQFDVFIHNSSDMAGCFPLLTNSSFCRARARPHEHDLKWCGAFAKCNFVYHQCEAGEAYHQQRGMAAPMTMTGCHSRREKEGDQITIAVSGGSAWWPLSRLRLLPTPGMVYSKTKINRRSDVTQCHMLKKM